MAPRKTAKINPDLSENNLLERYGIVSGTTGAHPVTSALHCPSCSDVEGSTAERILVLPVPGATQLHAVLPYSPHREWVGPVYELLSLDKSESTT